MDKGDKYESNDNNLEAIIHQLDAQRKEEHDIAQWKPVADLGPNW